ncbi:helix-turn-helix domain-containing protein [Streptomyces sp. SID11385]|uniref:helix-turn-helix domain-containing protein n=1 Tax=Streptomyces sp. SID11385 TaxID=2706031 RepID=UPI0013C67F28|nr:helix-turn-helix domain-containing protein [Streptomyces sp. SID11385]
MSLVDAPAHEIRYLPGGAREHAGAVKVFFQLGGATVVRQGNREATLEPGALSLVDTARPYRLLGEGAFRSLILLLPRTAVDLGEPELAQLAATAVTPHDALARIVLPHLSETARHLDAYRGEAGGRLARGTAELVGALLRTRLGTEAADPRRARRARLRAEAEEWMRAHLGEAGLGPEEIAAGAHMSTRQLHSLFHDTGTTVSAWLRARRLEAARDDLADPLLRGLTVTAIALRRGFTDSSHFTRAFKAEHGVTPSEYRAGARLRGV